MELIKFFQVSQGESTYLEYIFSADSITDFIYRVSVTEQLSKYNDKLIKDMNAMIKENNKNIDSLHEKEESLKSLQEELNDKVKILSSQKESLHEESASIQEEIESAKQILEAYTSLGCSDDEDIFLYSQIKYQCTLQEKWNDGTFFSPFFKMENKVVLEKAQK